MIPPPPRAGQYGVIYADPPWTFETYSAKGKGRSAEAHYDCMDVAQIGRLPVELWSANPCTLYLWATVPMLPEALHVMAAWQFKYKSSAVWVKDRIGTGYWWRNRHELLLIGSRGRSMCPTGRAVDSVIMGQQRAHSQKPDRAREIIEMYHPDAIKLEMFAREQAPGWDAWGLEAETGLGERRWKSNEGAKA